MNRYVSALLVMAFLSSPDYALGAACAPVVIPGNVGPWDYNDPEMRISTGEAPQTRLKLVENAHFRPRTEQLADGKSALTGDLTYTLNVIPNHPRALLALSRLEMREGGTLPPHTNNHRGPAECYFLFAIQYRPQDAMVRMVYGMHLHSRKRYSEALEAYGVAETLGLDSAQFQYNYGLLLFDVKEYDASYMRAKKAYEAGFPLPGLRNMLLGVGKWPEH